jgi:hypothetical protein
MSARVSTRQKRICRKLLILFIFYCCSVFIRISARRGGRLPPRPVRVITGFGAKAGACDIPEKVMTTPARPAAEASRPPARAVLDSSGGARQHSGKTGIRTVAYGNMGFSSLRQRLNGGLLRWPAGVPGVLSAISRRQPSRPPAGFLPQRPDPLDFRALSSAAQSSWPQD